MEFVSTYPGVVIRAILDRDSWLAESSWNIVALSVATVLADLSVRDLRLVVVNVWDNDVLGLTLSNNGFL